MAANRRKQDDKNLEILRELISLKGNRYCFDCNERGPTYVNMTIGSFVCSKCSGILRGLTPPHRVKSISMATFTSEEIEFIKARGNEYCRPVWLALYDPEKVPREQSHKDFMANKYEEKRFYYDEKESRDLTNGTHSKNKVKSKSGSATTHATQLISIAPQTSKTTNNNNGRVVNNILPLMNEKSARLPRPTNNLNQATNNFIRAPITAAPIEAPVPDFPVDFSTANIYNSSQFTMNTNNNVVSQTTNTPLFNAFNNTAPATNDRYAALADLDHAFRQQNLKTVAEESSPNVNNKNPFQSSASELFANKNPFFSEAWSVPAAPVAINPFMPSTNNGNYVNSKNPFL